MISFVTTFVANGMATWIIDPVCFFRGGKSSRFVSESPTYSGGPSHIGHSEMESLGL